MHENEPSQDQDQTDSQEYNSDKTNLLFSKKNNKSYSPNKVTLHLLLKNYKLLYCKAIRRYPLTQSDDIK